jgi:hypothetical protein
VLSVDAPAQKYKKKKKGGSDNDSNGMLIWVTEFIG